MNGIQLKNNYPAVIGTGYLVQAGQENLKTQNTGRSSGTFAQILQNNIQKENSGLTFSKHALKRIDERKIDVSPHLTEQMSCAVNKANGKGVKDALILSGTAAFIVNVPSKTVITAMNGGEMKDNIFTNIDGAVII